MDNLLLKKEKYAGAINETQKEKEISKRTTNSWSFGLKTFDAHSVREGQSQEKFTKARTRMKSFNEWKFRSFLSSGWRQ
jgi:hypothetical protein